LAGAVLLPSAAWHAAQTWLAIDCALALSWAAAPSAIANPTAHTSARIIPSSPSRMERRDFIRLFSQAQFFAAVGRPAELPPPGPPEVVFAGRSNVGKSSAINALLGRKRLAFTSKTPGRTQTINFYDLGGAARLVDLPGYGYARAPQALRTQWRELVGAYLKSRPRLTALVVIMDARHPFTPLDRQLLEWLDNVPKLIVLSKADKLSRSEQTELKKKHAQALLFSSTTRQGVEECRDLLQGWLQQAAEIKSPR
jgi:GTP-binding protein